MDAENRQGKSAEDDFSLRMKNLRAAAKKDAESDLTTKEGKRNLRRV